MENENLKNQETNSIEQKPINPETDWIIKNVDKDFESLSPEKKQEALDNLRKELESKYDMVAPDMNFGAKNVKKETGIIKQEKNKESSIQSRDEFLQQHFDSYSEQKFGKDESKSGYVEKGALNEYSDEMMERGLKGEDVSGLTREQFLDNYFKKYFKDNIESKKSPYPEGKGIESIPEDQREALQEEAIKEFEAIQKQSKDQNIETEIDEAQDSLKEKTQQDNIEAQSKDQTSYQEHLKEIQEENDKIKENIEPREFSYPEGKGIESIPEDEREALQEEAIKEFEAIKEQSENQEGFKEQLETLEKMENNESFEEDEIPIQGEAQKQETDGQRRLGKIGKGLQAVGGWILGKTVEFIASLPARWYDLTAFLWELSNSILEGNPGSYLQKFIDKRLKTKQRQFEASLYGER